MFADVEKIEFAARMTMGDFEGPPSMRARTRSKFPLVISALAVLTIVTIVALILN